MPRHYRKTSAKLKGVKTLDKEMTEINAPKIASQKDIFENYSVSQKDKENSKKKISKKKISKKTKGKVMPSPLGEATFGKPKKQNK